jgi:acetyl-CoA acetyltransferase
MSDRPAFLGRTAVAGVGYTTLSRESGRPVLDLAVDACRAALADCSLDAGEVDGIVSYSLYNDSVPVNAVATALAVPGLAYALDLNLGGQGPCFAVMNAAMAVSTGVARNVLVFRALNGRSGVRIGSTQIESSSSPYRYPIGFSSYVEYLAMWTRRFMIETAATEDDLYEVVRLQRAYAAQNDRAIRRSALSHEAYLAAPMVADPLRSADCTVEVDGACAVLVTSIEQARDLAVPPVTIEGAAWTSPKYSGLDIADLHSWPDYSRNAHSYLAERLWRSAGLGPADIDVAEIYDCFSSVVLFGLEALGFAGRGEAGDFLRSGAAGPGGTLPVNTHGGLLCEGYLHGMNTLAEGVLQLQGRGGSRQVAGARTGVVTSGALMDGSALVLAGAR